MTLRADPTSALADQVSTYPGRGSEADTIGNAVRADPADPALPKTNAALATFQLYTPWVSRLAAALPWLILAFALADVLSGGADLMFATGLVAAAVAGFLVSSLNDELRDALGKVVGRNLLAARAGSRSGLDEDLSAFLGDFERALRSRWSWALAAFFAVAAVPQFFLLPWAPPLGGLLKGEGFPQVRALLGDGWIIGLIGAALVGFVLGRLAWGLVWTGFFIHRMGAAFDVRIQDQHPDGAGGFGPVGEVCFLNALILIVPATFLGVWRTLLASVPAYRDAYGYLASWFGVLLLVTFVLGVIAFVTPLYGVHGAMARDRARRQPLLNQIGNELDQLSQRVRAAAATGDADAVSALRRQQEILRAVYQKVDQVPTWPVDIGLMRKFAVSQIVPLLSLTRIAETLTARLFGSS